MVSRWVWFFFPVLVFSASAQEVNRQALIVKLKEPVPRWAAADRLFSDLMLAGNATELETVVPAFSESSDWMATSSFPADQYYVVYVRRGHSVEKMEANLRQLPGVESVEPDYALSDPSIATAAMTTLNDPQLKVAWYLSELKVPDAWEFSHGENISVADVESGFDVEHPDLRHNFDLDNSHDYDPDTDNPNKVNDNDQTHGTPVCGLIGAEGNNESYGAGIAYRAKLIGSQMANSMKVQSKESLWTVITAKAILGSIERGASVILVEKQLPSLMATVERVPIIRDAILAAIDKGTPVIIPAGNFSQELKKEALLTDSGSIVVGATSEKGEICPFSNFGVRVNVFAPGENIYSVQEHESETFDFGGTSSAAAMVAGVTALLRSIDPKLSPKELRNIMVATGKAVKEEAGMNWFSVLPNLMQPQTTAPLGKLPNKAVLIQAGPAARYVFDHRS